MATSSPCRRRIGFLLFNGITALDVVGPMEAFAATRLKSSKNADQKPGYELLTIGLTTASVVSESGLILRPSVCLKDCPALDTLIIPGGRGLRDPRTNRRVSAWIQSRAEATRRIAAICTGIFGVAPTGLLNGRNVTTHWQYASYLTQHFPALMVDSNALFLKDGKFYTSAGITAGIDLSLALIEEDFGAQAALTVARELVVYMKRPGGQAQYSEPLRFQALATDDLREVDAQIRAHLDLDLSVSVLARSACLSQRQFTRRFQAVFKTTPAAYVQQLRLEEACSRLAQTQCRIDLLARSVGFRSDDAFRRAFGKQFGLAPGEYRQRFGGFSQVKDILRS